MQNLQRNNAVRIKLNRKQQEVHDSVAPIKVLQWSRRTGKNFIAGFETGMKYFPNLPKGNFSFINQDILQLKNQSVPEMESVWNLLGYKQVTKENRYGHYIKWQSPPTYFNKSWQEPNDYANIISFINGIRIIMLGLNRKNAARGGTDDFMFVDEACFINLDVFMNSVKPRLSGPLYRYPGNPYHRNLLMISSAPDTTEGHYIYDYEALAKAEPKKYHFSKATVWDNQRVLGIEFIRDLKKTIREDIWDREYENLADARPQSIYYKSFDKKKHVYDSDRYLHDPHYIPNHPLQISFDFNTNFECGVVGQKHSWGKTTQQEFFRENLDDLCEAVCDFYEDHKDKTIFVAGDVTGNHGRSGSRKVLYKQIKEEFTSRGWKVIIVTTARKQPKHEPRFKLFERLFSEKHEGDPKLRISSFGCPSLIKAMEMTAALNDYEKDKRCERGKTNRQFHTHLPDAWDYGVWEDYKDIILNTDDNFKRAIVSTK